MSETFWKDSYREHEPVFTLEEWRDKPLAFARFLLEEGIKARQFLQDALKNHVPPDKAKEYLSLLDKTVDEMVIHITEEEQEEGVDALLSSNIVPKGARQRRRFAGLGKEEHYDQVIRLLDQVRSHLMECLDHNLWRQRQSLPARFDADILFEGDTLNFPTKKRVTPEIEDVLDEMHNREQKVTKLKEEYFRDAYEWGGEDALPEASLSALHERARARLRGVSGLWRLYEEEDIGLFSNDLTRQPSYAVDIYFTPLDEGNEPGEQYEYDSDDYDYIKNMRDAVKGAHFKRMKDKPSRVYVFAAQPSLRERIAALAFDGQLPDEVDTLVHELRHQRQEVASPGFYGHKGGVALSETQAEMNLPLQPYPMTLHQAIDFLNSASYKHYEIPTDMAICAAEFIASANAMGLNQEEISRMIVRAEWDDAAKRYANLDSALKKLRNAMGIKESDVPFLWDMARAQRKSQVLQIQIVFLEEMIRELEKVRPDDDNDKRDDRW